MKPPSPPRIPCWVIESVLPVAYREAIVGDLIEEYVVLATSTSRFSASLWFWGQACRSIPSMAWSLLRHGDWPRRLRAALSIYIAMAILKASANLILARLISPGETMRIAIAPLMFLGASAVGGYVLSRIRPEATILLALMVMASVTTLVAINICSASVPWWYQVGFLTLGPLSVLVTPGIVQSTRRALEHHCFSGK